MGNVSFLDCNQDAIIQFCQEDNRKNFWVKCNGERLEFLNDYFNSNASLPSQDELEELIKIIDNTTTCAINYYRVNYSEPNRFKVSRFVQGLAIVSENFDFRVKDEALNKYKLKFAAIYKNALIHFNTESNKCTSVEKEVTKFNELFSSKLYLDDSQQEQMDRSFSSLVGKGDAYSQMGVGHTLLGSVCAGFNTISNKVTDLFRNNTHSLDFQGEQLTSIDVLRFIRKLISKSKTRLNIIEAFFSGDTACINKHPYEEIIRIINETKDLCKNSNLPILMPVVLKTKVWGFINSSHIVYILVKGDVVRYYDPMGKLSKNVQLPGGSNRTLYDVLTFLNSSNGSIVENHVPQQNDLNNCGVLVCLDLHRILIDKHLLGVISTDIITTETIYDFRSKMKNY